MATPRKALKGVRLMTHRIAWVAVALALAPALASAQARPPRQAPRPVRTTAVVDLSVFGGMFTATALGSADANLRANATTPQAYRLFSTTTEREAAPLLDVRFDWWATRRVAVGGRALASRPQLTTTISNDVELVPDLAVSERLNEVILDGGVLVRLDSLRRPHRTWPYVTGGVGILRQMHEGATDGDNHRVVRLGGGVRHALVSGRRGAVKSVGLSAEAQVMLVSGELLATESRTSRTAVTGGVTFGF